MNLSFENKVALVTGAGAGIGLATAKAFAEAGASVVLANRDEKAIGKATKELHSAGYNAIGVACDVTEKAQVATLIEQAVNIYGRLDAAFNNAGINTGGAPLESAVESLALQLTPEDVAYLEEPYVPHPIVGLIPYPNK